MDRIEKAISSGTLRVKFSDKEVAYQNLSEMLKARDVILRTIDIPNRKNRVVSRFDKGL